MKRYLGFLLLFVPVVAFADTLGWETTPDGLIMRQPIDTTNDENWPSQVGIVTEINGVHTHDVGATSCQVTRNADITEIDIAECIIHVRGEHYRFAAVTSIDPAFPADDSSVFIGYSSGGLVKQGSSFTDAQRDAVIPIARIQAAKGQAGPGSDISDLGVSDLRPIVSSFEKVVLLWVKDFNGPLVKSGFIASESGTRNIDLTAGTFSDTQLRSQSVPAFTSITGLTIFHTALGNLTSVLDVVQFDNVNYDDPVSGLTPMTNNNWYAAHNLMMSQDGTDRDPRYALLYSQTEYIDLAAAQAADFDFGPFLNADPRWVPITKVIIKKNDVSATEFQDTRPRNTVWGN